MANQLSDHQSLQYERRGTSTNIGRPAKPVVDKRLSGRPRGKRDPGELGLAVHRGVDNGSEICVACKDGANVPLQ